MPDFLIFEPEDLSQVKITTTKTVYLFDGMLEQYSIVFHFLLELELMTHILQSVHIPSFPDKSVFLPGIVLVK